jgi:hypothetical protein
VSPACAPKSATRIGSLPILTDPWQPADRRGRAWPPEWRASHLEGTRHDPTIWLRTRQPKRRSMAAALDCDVVCLGQSGVRSEQRRASGRLRQRPATGGSSCCIDGRSLPRGGALLRNREWPTAPWRRLVERRRGSLDRVQSDGRAVQRHVRSQFHLEPGIDRPRVQRWMLHVGLKIWILASRAAMHHVVTHLEPEYLAPRPHSRHFPRLSKRFRYSNLLGDEWREDILELLHAITARQAPTRTLGTHCVGSACSGVSNTQLSTALVRPSVLVGGVVTNQSGAAIAVREEKWASQPWSSLGQRRWYSDPGRSTVRRSKVEIAKRNRPVLS